MRYEHTSLLFSLTVRIDGIPPPMDILVLTDLPGWPALRDSLVELVDHDRPDCTWQYAIGHLLESLIVLAVTPRAEHENRHPLSNGSVG